MEMNVTWYSMLIDSSASTTPRALECALVNMSRFSMYMPVTRAKCFSNTIAYPVQLNNATPSSYSKLIAFCIIRIEIEGSLQRRHADVARDRKALSGLWTSILPGELSERLRVLPGARFLIATKHFENQGWLVFFYLSRLPYI